MPLVALHVLALYPRQRAWLRPRAFPALGALAAAAALELLHLADHALFWALSARAGDPRGPFLDAPVGPLLAFAELRTLAYAVVACALAREALDQALPGPRRPLHLVSLGFASVVVCDGLTVLLLDAPALARPPRASPS